MKRVLATAVALIMALVGCQPKEPRRIYVFSGFNPVKVVEDDPVAVEAGKFFDSYQHDVEDDASNSYKDFVREYNSFAAKVRPSIALPTASAELDRDAALDANAKLNAYLAPKGWLFRIADAYASDLSGEPMIIRMLMMGKLHSVRHGKLTDVRGTTVSYTESIVAYAKQTRAREKTFRFTAFTEGREIYHFLDGLEWSARRVIDDCRDGAADGAEFSQLEWADYLKDGTTPQFEARVMGDLLRSASAHERQHVVDHEFGELRLTKDDAAIMKVKFLMETRGLLAQIASGDLEIYGLGHAAEWQESSERLNSLAGWAVMQAIGQLPKDPAIRNWLRRKASAELKTSDLLVLSSLRHKADPDPVGRAKEEYQYQRGR
ncbi:hypothetical protein HY622_00255 [Candidatus Uhrbacteria bacterium]|nr:hypothetical protein [Candidatus Uhrbacteria bacterium]